MIAEESNIYLFVLFVAAWVIVLSWKMYKNEE